MAEDDDSPMVVSWKAFWCGFGSVVTASVGMFAVLASLPFFITLLLAVAAAAVFVVGARIAVHGAGMFAEVSDDGRRQILRWICAGVLAHLLWIVALQMRPDLWFALLAGLAVLGAIEYWLARGHEYLLTKLVRAAAKEVEEAQAKAAQGDEVTRGLRATLNRAGFSWLTIVKWEPVGEPEPHGIAALVQEPSRATLVQTAGKTAATNRLNPSHAESIAIALGEITGTEVMSDWVSITKERGAGRHRIVIVDRDVMADVHPYQDTLAWSSFEEPVMVGYDLSSKQGYLRIDQHGEYIGASREGKSSLINTVLAHTTRAADGYTWLCGTEKLYDLVGGWLQPYMDTDLPLPFDWIASGQKDTVGMLVAAMSVARYRQRVPIHLRRPWKKILVVMDEASFPLSNRKVKGVYQGVEYSASELVAMLVKGGASGGVFVHLASQRATYDNWGDQGGSTNANLGFAACFRSNDVQEIGRTIGDYHLPNPRFKGAYWLRAGDGEPPRMLKAPYIQEVDPMRPRLHDGLTVSDVSWSRQQFVREPLDEGSARAAGELYANRHVRMDAEFLAYLTNAEEPEDESSTGAEDLGRAMVQAEMDKLGIPRPSDLASSAAPASEPGNVTTLDGRRTRADRIAEIVRDSPRPLVRGDILTALRSSGDDPSEQVVTNALKKLVETGRLERREGGLYVAR